MGEALVGQGHLTRMQVEVEAGEDAHQGWNGDEAVGNTGLEREGRCRWSVNMPMCTQHVFPRRHITLTHCFPPTRTHKHIINPRSDEPWEVEEGARGKAESLKNSSSPSLHLCIDNTSVRVMEKLMAQEYGGNKQLSRGG